jgi:hypothetical protein
MFIFRWVQDLRYLQAKSADDSLISLFSSDLLTTLSLYQLQRLNL